MNADYKVSLGCGTLILIALIVLIFGNMGEDNASGEISRLDARIQSLESLIKGQTEQIERLQTSIDSLRQELRQVTETSGTD
jgi:septal ring factor EnvC (AmiA/AmiB activator)